MVANTIPKVSVIMPVYNRANKLLHGSIKSVLCQSLSDFEFLILDDGSNDNTLAIIKQYAKQDKRIRVLQNDQNRGIPFSTNRLLDNVKTKFAALLDSDDKCYPHRLEKQYEFFQKNPDIDIVGTQSQLFRFPLSDWEIKTWHSFYKSALVNTSVMIKMQTINAHNIRYRSDFPFSQDYQLWVDCMPFVKFSNLNDVLVHITTHADQAGTLHNERQQTDHLRTLQEVLQKHNIQVHNRVLITLLGWQEGPSKKEDIHGVLEYITRILNIEDFYDYPTVHQESLRSFCWNYFTLITAGMQNHS